MPVRSKKSIEDVLLKDNLISEEQANQLKLEMASTGLPAEKVVRDSGLVSEEEIVKAKAEIISVPYVDISKKGITVDILNKIPEPVAKRYNLIPFDLTKNILSVVMADPLDLQVIAFLEAKTGLKIKAFIGLPGDIATAVQEQYSTSIDTEVRAALKEAQTETQELKESISDLSKVEDVIQDAPVARIVSTILEYAVKSRASDVHIEPGEEKTRVRYRIDGVLQERVFLPIKVTDAVVSRIKILSNLKIDEKRIPQDGRFQIKVAEQEIDLRVSTLPASWGEKVVMRLLRRTGGVPTFADLGLRGKALKIFEENLLRPHGIILITGPTGSGKSTTISSALTKINNPKVNIVTLEDPVEYRIPGVNQVQINPQAGLTFASGLRSILRQDPNVIMVGEIRDMETAELAVQAALTGHLVLSTLHTNSAAGTLPRLLDMQVEPFLIASTVNIAVAQRLCRRVCQKCKVKVEISKEVMHEMMKVLGPLWPDKSPTLYMGKGCNECNKTGYNGRIGIYEVLSVTEKIGRMILERQPADTIEKEAVLEGMLRMKQDGYLKVMDGLTTFEEVLRVAQD